MEGKYMRRAKIHVIPENSITERRNICKYVGRNTRISMYKMNMNVDENVTKYYRLTGSIKYEEGGKIKSASYY